MTGLEIFSYAGQQVRTVLKDGAPWFVGRDACAVLGLNNVSMALGRLDQDGVSTTDLIDSMGRRQVAAVVSEAGLYELIFMSRRAEAKAFRRWVTHEVLPTIRRTGQFGSQVPTSFAEALEMAAAKQRAIEAAEAKIALDAPKVAAYDKLMDADGYYEMGAAAKILRIGRNTLFRMLRDECILQSGSNLPYQRYMHHFAVTTSTYTTPDGSTHLTHTTRVRPTGLDLIAKRLGIVLGSPLELS